ncbi:MAG: DNA translocase FtsK [Phormidesmis sp.]
MSTTAPYPSPNSLSVTKVRVAFECPRLMYLGHHEGGMTMFRASHSKGGGVGLAFHKLCDDCVDRICTDGAIAQLLIPPATQLNPETLAQQIQQQLYRTVFFPLVQTTVKDTPSRVPALNQLWEGITGLIRRWAELLVSNRSFCEPKDVIRKTFLAQELSVKHEFDLPNGDRQLVKGRFDSLVYDFAAQRLCVVDYKTYQATDPAAQLAQVALYSYMLKQRLQVNINSAVYSVLPDWKGVEYPWDLLEKTLHELIPYKLMQMRDWLAWRSPHPNPPPPTAHLELCNICPQKNKCQTYFEAGAAVTPAEIIANEPSQLKNIPPLLTGSVAESFTLDYSQPVKVETLQVESLRVESIEVESLPAQKPAARPKPPAKPLPPNKSTPIELANDASDKVATQLVEVLQSFNVGVDYLGSVLAPAFVRVKLMPHLGVRVSSILKFEDDIRVHLGLSNPPLMAPQAGYISVDLPRPDRQTAFFERYYQQPEMNSAQAKVAIGVNLDGELIEADLSDPNTCHFLVGGTTGSGKSEFLRSLLLSLLVHHDPKHFQVALVDPKRVTFPEFENMRWLYEPIVKTREDAIALMERLVIEMDERYHRFEKSRCNDLFAYNQKAASPLPRILCIFDEYADFMADKETAKALEQSIQRLGAMARAAGIHLVIATQRPEARVVTPLIRSNLPGRVALRTASDADSAIILGGKEGAAANLLGKGDLFYSGGGGLQRLQSLFAPAQTVASLIQ